MGDGTGRLHRTRLPRAEPFWSWATKVKDIIKNFEFLNRRPYTRDDLPVETFFDTVPDSRAMYVPVYTLDHGVANEAFSWALKRHGPEQAKKQAEKEFLYRKQDFLDELASHTRTLLMVHFHYIDYINHLYGDPDVKWDKDRLREEYSRIDEFAGDIRDRAEEKYDTVLFMSDHGLPTKTEHNNQAFYSCNKELGLDTPHITDFHDIILDRVNTVETTAGLDI